MDTSNDFFLGSSMDGTFTFLIPPTRMDREQALRMAAWVIAMADPLQEDFPQVLEAVMST